MQRFGIDKRALEDQLSKFQEVHKINEELEPDKVYIYQRHFNEKERKFYYTIITNRKNALQITEAFIHHAVTRGEKLKRASKSEI